MWRSLLTGSIVFAVSTVAPAGDSLTPVSLDTGTASVSDWSPVPAYHAPYLRDTNLGAWPHSGHQCSPTQGYDHYDLPSKHYGMWYRPAAFAEDSNPHCASRAFSPRGKGWANRDDCMQMDYRPYMVQNVPAAGGPAYYHRPAMEPCHAPGQGRCCSLRGVLTR